MVIFYFFIFAICYSSELFEEFYPKAEEYLNNMTLEEKVGQMFFPRYYPEYSPEDIKNLKIGGLVLYGKDFNFTKKYIQTYIRDLQELALNYTKLPLGLAVDEEGGIVFRVSQYHRKEGIFPSPQNIYRESGIEGILKIDQEKRDLLREFFLNINFAPVADISYNPSDYIYSRTLGEPANITADYIAKDVEGYVKDRFTCCAKHFPGYGNNVNTHDGRAYDNRSYDIFLNEDFLPFEAAIANKIPMILVSHNIIFCKDEYYPASISKVWHDILRDDLNYSGLIVTDDLYMDAIKNFSYGDSAAVLAVQAGNDVILSTDYHKHIEDVINAVKVGNITEDIIDKACRRIIAWKLKYLDFSIPEIDEGDDTSDQTYDNSTDDTSDQTYENSTDDTSDQTHDNTTDDTSDQIHDNSTDSTTDSQNTDDKSDTSSDIATDSSNTTDTSDTEDKGNSDDNTTLIVSLSVVGGILIISLIVFFFVHSKKKANSSDIEETSGLLKEIE